MQIRRLRLRNIRSYERADVRFEGGTTLVSGDVGSGKTSLLYAIEMALFGFAEVDAAYLVRHLAADAEVRLTLEETSHRYELVRRFTRKARRGKDVFELEENAFSSDGATRAYSATELRQRAIDLLGFPDNPNPRAHSDLWRWAVYVPQEKMREVLDQKPEDRLETVRKALGLEQYRVAADNALDVAADLRRTAESRTAEAERLGHWTEDLPRWASTLDDRRAELALARPSEIGLRARLRRTEEELTHAEVELNGLIDQEREGTRLAAESTRLRLQAEEKRGLAARRGEEAGRSRAKASEAERTAAQTETTRALETRLVGEKEQLKSRLRTLEDARRTLAAAESEVAAAAAAERTSEMTLREAVEDHSRLEAVLRTLVIEEPVREPRPFNPMEAAEIETRLDLAQSQLETALSECLRLETEVAEVGELLREGICPRCKQPVAPGEFAAHRDEFRQRLAKAEVERDRLKAERDRFREERAERELFERAHLRWSELEERRALARVARSAGVERARRGEEAVSAARAHRETATIRREEARRRAGPFEEVERVLAEVEGRLTRATQDVQLAHQAAERVQSATEQAVLLDAEATRLVGEAADSEHLRAEIDHRRGEIDARHSFLEDARGRVTGLKADVVRLRSELDLSSRSIGRLESQLDEASRRIEEAKAGVEEQRRLAGIAAHHRVLAQWLARPFREALLKLEHRLLARAQDEFDRSFARFFATLIEDPSLVARCDVAFTPLVEIEGEWTPPEALSGGERTALALAYRLALGQVVRSAGRLKLDTLILDEPTDGFSPEQVARMGELLEELAIPQVVLVSHEGGLASVADRVIRVRKEGGLSIVVPEEGMGGRPTDGPEIPAPAVLPLDLPGGKRRRVRTPRLDAPAAGATTREIP